MKPDPSPEKKPTEPGEADLWDFSDDSELKPAKKSAAKKSTRTGVGKGEKRLPDDPVPNAIPITPRGPRRGENAPFAQKQPKKKDSENSSDELIPAGTEELPLAAGPKVEAEFEDLDPKIPANPVLPASDPVKSAESEIEALHKPEPTPEPEAAPAKSKSKRSKKAARKAETKAEPPSPPAPVSEVIPEPEPKVSLYPGIDYEPETISEEDPDAGHEIPFSAKPIAKKILSSLSKAERIGLISFLVLLLGTILFFVAYSLNKIPETHKDLTSSDFPIQGSKIEAVSVDTYWRPPNENGETFRRGTVLVPVLELKVNGGPGAVRIFFRNPDGESIGDAVTRPVNGPTNLKIAATAGFDDLGMHAAYRATTDGKRWVVEVHEGPSISATGSQFKKLFEIPISTSRR